MNAPRVRMLDSELAPFDEELIALLNSIHDASERYFVHSLLSSIVWQPDPISASVPKERLDMVFLATVFREIYRDKEFLLSAAQGDLVAYANRMGSEGY